MSVIIQTAKNEIKLYCKGAVSFNIWNMTLINLFLFQDTVIMERLESNNRHVQITSEHLENFANSGLRTLCCSYRILTIEEYNVIMNIDIISMKFCLSVHSQEWLVKYQEASTAINNRNALVAEVADKIEQNLILLGATGIEDRLQNVISFNFD